MNFACFERRERTDIFINESIDLAERNDNFLSELDEKERGK